MHKDKKTTGLWKVKSGLKTSSSAVNAESATYKHHVDCTSTEIADEIV